MRTNGCTGRSLLVAGLLALASAGRAAAQDVVVYDDSLQNGFTDSGWAPDRNFADTSQHHGGTRCLSFSSDASWQGVILHGNVNGTTHETLQIWVRGAAAGIAYSIIMQSGGGDLGSASLASFVPGGTIPSGSWALATIPLASLGVPYGAVADQFVIQGQGTQAKIFLDDIVLIHRTTPPPPPVPVTVTVDPNGASRPINPMVYGVSHFDDAGSSQLAYPVRRWGGNATTRYNWEIDVSNHASDWFFLNIPGSAPNPSQLPNNSSADLWIDSVKAHQGEPALTVPMIGWVPKGSNPNTDRVQLWGMSVLKYGPQQNTECTVTGNPPWCHGDAGNGCTPSSPPGTCTPFTPAVPFDATDTSKPAGPSYVTQWMSHIFSRVGTAANGGVKYYILDNEPALWNSTHRDVHPNPLTYDELWAKTQAMALAIKTADPSAKVVGFAEWGWCGYWSSASDGQCSGNAGADYTSHGNLHMTPWYLKQVADYQALHGIRLIDYLDFHFYPQGSGIYSTSEGGTSTQALRLRSLKSLYDPNYVDESWINQVPVKIVNLIPRMRDWIAQYAPGTKIAIGEYNFGDGAGASSALAQAEALAIFGREGVDMANRWTVPDADTLLEDAFLLYLNYNAAGAKVSGSSIPATSSDVDGVGAYAVRGTDKLYLLLFNKDTVDRQASVTLAGGLSATAFLWRFSGSMRLGSAGTTSVTAGSLSLTLPIRSATLVVIPYAAPTAFQYYSVTPCRVVDTRNAAGPLGGPSLGAGVTRTFSLAGTCGIPSTAKAVSLNVTVVPAGDGDLRLFPGDQGAPATSTINFRSGRVRANNAIMGISTDGAGALGVTADLTGGSTHVILDVNGYFQ